MGNKKRISLKRKRTFRGNQWNKTPTLEAKMLSKYQLVPAKFL